MNGPRTSGNALAGRQKDRSGRRCWPALAVLVAAMGCSSPHPPSDGVLEERRRELRETHAETIRRHLLRDAEYFPAALAPDFIEISGGEVTRPSRAEVLDRFSGYLGSTEFFRYEDVTEPVIGVSEDGRFGWVVAAVEVEGRQGGEAGEVRSLSFKSSWLANYRRADGRWLMTMNASDVVEIPPTVGGVLWAARKTLSPGPNPPEVRSFTALARVNGPSGSYEVRTVSSMDGRARLEMSTGFLAALDTAGGWRRTESGVVPLDSLSTTVVRGHELHLLAWAPQTRLYGGRYAGETLFRGEPAVTLEFRDAMGEPLRIHYRIADRLPLGLEVVNSTGDGERHIVVHFDAWSEAAGLSLLRRARFLQGADVYRYEYHDVELNGATPADFRSPG